MKTYRLLMVLLTIQALCMCSLRAQVVSYPYGLIDIGDGELGLGDFNYCRPNKPTEIAPLVIDALKNKDSSLLFTVAPNALSSSSQFVLEVAIANSTQSILDVSIPECFEEFVFHSLFDLLANDTLHSDIENVVILVHGWNPSGNPNQYSNEAFLSLTTNLIQTLVGTSWGLVQYRWEENASTGQVYNNIFGPGGPFNSPIEAASIGDSHGRYLAQELLEKHPRLKRVMLMCHSAGAWVGYRAAKILEHQSEDMQIELMLMDPFVPGSILFADSPLTEHRMSSLSEYGEGRLFLHNYHGDDGVDAFIACAGTLDNSNWDQLSTYGTHSVFEWNDRHIQLSLNEAYLLLGGLNVCRYGGHTGPIQFVSDTVARHLENGSEYTGIKNWNKQWDNKYGFQNSLFTKWLEEQKKKGKITTTENNTNSNLPGNEYVLIDESVEEFSFADTNVDGILDEGEQLIVANLLGSGQESYEHTVYIQGLAYDKEPQNSYESMQMCIPNHKGFETWHRSADLNLTETEFTIEGWWKPLGIPGYTTFMEKLKRGSDRTIGWCFELVHGTDLCFWYNEIYKEPTMFVAPNAVSHCDANTPMHLYVSVNQENKTAVMMKNGVALSVETRYAGSDKVECDPNVPFRFGASSAYSNREFHGTVRDWHIWKGQKGIEWIKSQSWFPGWYEDCIASWSFCKRDLDNGWIDDSLNRSHLKTAGYVAEMSLGALALTEWNALREETWERDPCTIPPVIFEDGMIYHYPDVVTVGYDRNNVVSDTATLPAFTTREFTISLWAQIPHAGEQALFSAQEYGSEGSNIGVWANPEGLCGSFLWGPSRASAGLCQRYTSLFDNNWHHIVYRYYEINGYPVADLYVDGTRVGIIERKEFVPYEPRDSKYYILLGARIDQGNMVAAHGGSIADVRIYPDKRSEAAIHALLSNGF